MVQCRVASESGKVVSGLWVNRDSLGRGKQGVYCTLCKSAKWKSVGGSGGVVACGYWWSPGVGEGVVVRGLQKVQKGVHRIRSSELSEE